MISDKTLIKMINLSKCSSLFSLLVLKVILYRQFKFCQEIKLNEEIEPTYVALLHPIHYARHIYVGYHIESSQKSRREALIAFLL